MAPLALRARLAQTPLRGYLASHPAILPADHRQAGRDQQPGCRFGRGGMPAMVVAFFVVWILARLAEVRNRHTEIYKREVKSARKKLWTAGRNSISSWQTRMDARKPKRQHRAQGCNFR